jgi:GTP-binding protein
VERSKALLHLVDMAQDFDASPWERFVAINAELSRYDPLLLHKKQLVVGTKLDIAGARERLAKFQLGLGAHIPIVGISCWTGEGINELIRGLFDLVGEGEDACE